MSQTITKTVVKIPGFGTRELQGFDLSVEQVKATMQDSVDLSGYQHTVSEEGGVRTIEFQRRVGNKG